MNLLKEEEDVSDLILMNIDSKGSRSRVWSHCWHHHTVTAQTVATDYCSFGCFLRGLSCVSVFPRVEGATRPAEHDVTAWSCTKTTWLFKGKGCRALTNVRGQMNFCCFENTDKTNWVDSDWFIRQKQCKNRNIIIIGSKESRL